MSVQVSSFLTMVQGEKRCLCEFACEDALDSDNAPLLGVFGVWVGMRSDGSKKYSTFSLPVICVVYLYCICICIFDGFIGRGANIWQISIGQVGEYVYVHI